MTANANTGGKGLDPAGGIASRIGRGGHQPLISQRKRGSTRYLIRKRREIKAIWFDERLDPVFREQIMVTVAGANSCRQCSYAHREWALAEGLPPAELAALEGLDESSFDERTWAAIAWAQDTARSGFTVASPAIEENFRKWFTPEERADIDLIARVMYWCNEISNGVDAAWSRCKGRPVPGSKVLREVEAVVVYALSVPILFVVLGVKEHRRPFEIVRGILPYFRHFVPHEDKGRYESSDPTAAPDLGREP